MADLSSAQAFDATIISTPKSIEQYRYLQGVEVRKFPFLVYTWVPRLSTSAVRVALGTSQIQAVNGTCGAGQRPYTLALHC